MFLTDPIQAGYVKKPKNKNGKTASQTTPHIESFRIRKGEKKNKEAAKCSEKFIIDSEMGPCDIIRVNKDRDGLPRVLSH